VEAKRKRFVSVTVAPSLTDAVYKQWYDSYLVKGVLTPVNISDSKFAFVPKFQVNASITYDFPIPQDLGKLSLRGSYYYQSAIQTAEVNTSNCGPDGLYANCHNGYGALPGYGLGSARIDWHSVAAAPIDVSIFVNNITNKFYRPGAENAVGILGFASYSFGDPRTVGVEARVRFGRTIE